MKNHNHQHDPTPSFSIDWDFYAEYLEDTDLTDDQKREFLETLLSIVIGFVDLGFNVHPTQLAAKDAVSKKQTCEPIADNTPSLAPDMLKFMYDDNTSKTCAKTARSE